MTSWTRVTLKEVTEISKGLSYQGKFLTDHGLPLVNLKCIKAGGGLRPDATKPYSGPFKEQHVVLPGDLVIANTDLTQSGGVIGSPALVPLLSGHEHGIISHHLCRVRALPGAEINQRFLYYRLLSPDFKAFARSVASGTTVLGLRTSDIERFEFQIPESNVQERIGRALGGFDDLIENNRRRIELLEETARLLYREWFVHYRYPGQEDVPLVDSELGPIPGDWEICRADEVMGVVGGGTPSKKEESYWADGDIQWYAPTDLTRTGSMFALGSSLKINELGLAKSSANLFPAGSVMMTSRATIGEISFSTTEACTNQGFITCVPSEQLSGSHIYFWLEAHVPFFLQVSTGATFKELTKSTFRKLPIAIPPVSLEEEFCSLVDPLLQSVLNLLQQQQVLQSSRDLLLPRLVSGDLDISDLELNLEAVG